MKTAVMAARRPRLACVVYRWTRVMVGSHRSAPQWRVSRVLTRRDPGAGALS